MPKSRTVWRIIGVLLVCLLLFTAGCVPAGESGGAEGAGSGTATMIIFIVIMFAMMYFLMIRPQQKKQKEHKLLIEGLRKGDSVITTSGIYGKIERIGKDSIVLQVESGGTIRVAKDTIAGKIVPQ